jgi:hypothetical protein
MPTQDPIETAKELLDGISTEQFRAFGIEALRRWRKTANSTHFNFRDHFLRQVVPLLTKDRTVKEPSMVADALWKQISQRWAQPLVDFSAWLVGAGLAIALRYDGSGSEYAPGFRLTTAGEGLLIATDDHPLLPEFVERVVVRCPGLPEEVGAHLVDARACVDRGLGRPAVSLLGLAFEAAEDAAIEYLERNTGFQPPKNAKAKQRIAAVVKHIPKLFPGDSDRDKESRAIAAWDFADRLRDRRNQASHPRNFPDFSDLTEVHEFIVSAGRHLPGLWSVRI